MGMMASQIASLTIVFSTVYLDTDRRKHQSSASLAFMFPFDDIIMKCVQPWISNVNFQSISAHPVAFTCKHFKIIIYEIFMSNQFS